MNTIKKQIIGEKSRFRQKHAWRLCTVRGCRVVPPRNDKVEKDALRIATDTGPIQFAVRSGQFTVKKANVSTIKSLRPAGV